MRLVSDDAAITHAFDENGQALSRLRDAALPTIVLVNGPAAGFGMSLVASQDFAIAAEDATFHLPEAAIGLVPAAVAQDMLRVLYAAPRSTGLRLPIGVMRPPHIAPDWCAPSCHLPI